MEKIKIPKEYDLTKDYQESLNDPFFKKLVKDLRISTEVGMVNNSNLMDVAVELKNCSNCKGLYECQNKVLGHYMYPKIMGKLMDLGYVPCKYKKEQDRLWQERLNASKELEMASFKSVDVTDKRRVQLIKWLKDFFDNYDGIKKMKGLYLHGSFGSGKTYLIYALLNELKMKKRIDYIAIYYPEVLRTLKEDWDSFQDNMASYQNVPILLIDDIGAESVSEWSRDEVLGTILQARMNNGLTTFFTSNLSIQELEEHLSKTKIDVDKLKARRIIERIKQLTIDMELISDNKRK